MNRVPPNDLNAEASVLGAIMLEPATISVAADIVKPEDFYDSRHALIYAAATALWAIGKRADPTTIRDLLEQEGALERVGGDSAFANLIGAAPSADGIAEYAGIVASRALERRLIHASIQIQAACYAHQPDVLSLAQTQIVEATAQSVDAIEAAPDVRDAMLPTFSKPETVKRLPYGLPDLERHMVLSPGRLIYIAGRTNHGKSALAGKVAWEAAKRDANVLYVTMEMTVAELLARSLSAASGVAFTAMSERVCTEDEVERLRTVEVPPGLRMVTRPDLDGVRLRAIANSVRATYGLDLLVVDYLQQMSHPAAERRDLALGATSRMLKLMAMQFGIPVVVCAQLNRMSEGRRDGKPAVSDLRESGSLEQDADCVALVWRPWLQDSSKGRDDFRVIVGKNRHDPPGEVEMVFFAETMRIECRANEPVAVYGGDF